MELKIEHALILSACVLKKCRQKISQPGEFKHITWWELFSYSVRQAWHTYKGTYTASLKKRKLINKNLLRMETPYGEVFLPPEVDQRSLQYLLREAFDHKHWHQYQTRQTPLCAGDIVVDCGPSEGLWSLRSIRQVQKIYLIEPQSTYAKLLEKTFAFYIGQGRAKVINSAVGRIDGRCHMVKRIDADTLATAYEDPNGETALARLDTLFEKQPLTFIKADIEGAEMDLLKGARKVIKRDKPKLALTVYHDTNDWRAMRDFVIELVPQYSWCLKGMLSWGKPLMLHMWVADSA